MSASVRWVVVDDTDSNITYTGPWFLDQGSQNNVGNFGPAYESTLHGTKSNASLSYAFSGSKVTVFGSNNILNSSGVLDPSWECFIDKISIGATTPFAFAENNWVFCNHDELVDGPHVLTVNATITKGQAFWFDDIQYVPSASVPLDNATIFVDNLDPQLQYGAGWTALGDTANMTTQTGSNFTFKFIGISLSWYGFIPHELPITATTGSYSVDGQNSVQFLLPGLSSNTTTIYNQKFFETARLSSGSHQIIVTFLGNSSTTPLTLDYLIVQNGTVTSSAGSSTPTSSNGATSGTKSSTNIGAIVGGVIGGLILVALVFFGFYLYRRRSQKSNEKNNYEESTPYHGYYTAGHPIESDKSGHPTHQSISDTSSAMHPLRSIDIMSSQIQSSMDPTTIHSSIPSVSATEFNSAIAPSSSSGMTFPTVNTAGHQQHRMQNFSFPVIDHDSSLNISEPMINDKERREAEATTTSLRRLQRSPDSPLPMSDLGSRVVRHEDSGIRLPPNRPTSVEEIPPLYTAG